MRRRDQQPTAADAVRHRRSRPTRRARHRRGRARAGGRRQSARPPGACRWASTSPNDTLFAAEKPLELVNYLLRRRGMLTSNVGEAYGFVKSRAGPRTARSGADLRARPVLRRGPRRSLSGHAVVMGPILLKPHSSGTITLRSADPKDKPIIDPRYLTDSAGADREALMAGLRMCATIAKSPALSGIIGSIARPLERHDPRRGDTGARAELVVAHAVSPGGHLQNG